jgi:beta-lactamase class A
MMAALAAVQAGRLSLDQKLTIEARFQDNDSGTFQHLTPGFWVTLRDALVMMIIVSDNTCTGLVCDAVGLPEIQRYCEGVGMTGTIHRFGIPPRLGRDHALEEVTVTTPNDQGLLLELILRGTTDPAVAQRLGVTTELCRLGLDILSWQKLKTRLPSLLPLGTRVAHKTGTGSRGFMDAGVVFRGDQPLFILTAYTEHVPVELPDGIPGFAAAYQLIGRMARLTWDALGTRAPAAAEAMAGRR